jgi:alkane 1-monooxygenase
MTAAAMIPPLWRRIMNPRVRAWRREFYPEVEDWTAYNKGLNPPPR